MQSRAGGQRDLWDVESVAGQLLSAGNVFAFLAEHRQELFADLFPPDVMAPVIVSQTFHGFSDREAADAVTFDLRWKAACGVPMTPVRSTGAR